MKVKRHLCNFCTKTYPECDARSISYGCDYINTSKKADNVVECNAFMSEDRNTILEGINVYVEMQSGERNTDPYMHGMLNGLILARSVVDGKQLDYHDAPKKWTDKSENFARIFYVLHRKVTRFFSRPKVIHEIPKLDNM